MEDWKLVKDAGFEFQDSDWDHSEVHRSHHDPLEHWKPASETGFLAHRLSLDDPPEVYRNLHATLIEKEICADHVIKVWNEISKVIVEKLKEGYGVKIAGLGTFTYCLEPTKLPSMGTSNLQGQGQGQRPLKKVPIMILSEFVVRMYNLITPLEESLSNIPIVSLNLTQVILKTRLPRKIVEGIITELLQSFARAVVCGKNVEFPFPYIGKLQISDKKVMFKFYTEFCNQLDFASEVKELDPTAETEPDPFILPGAMTPLRRHIPTPDFRSVFHLREVRSVHQFELLAPVKRLQSGKYTATSGLDGDQPVCTIVEDRNYRKPFKVDNLYGHSLHNRLTVSWVRGKRDYKSLELWPPHHFHVVGSGIVLRQNLASQSMAASTTTTQLSRPVSRILTGSKMDVSPSSMSKSQILP